MESHHLRKTAQDHGNRGTGLYGLRWHGGARMGIHDGGEWQLKERSWELDMVRKVLWRKAEEFWGERERNFSVEELRAWWLVFTDFLPLR
jgi:hypothetical protein